ncbi:hypothetical protein ACIQC9_14195 [Brevundimonas sp. NPDC092305]|uniref:hypothetical protein n=1 Tax=Brevundimonas sp. NPDC092305 TaxID=3363957 RepID=UPI0038184367
MRQLALPALAALTLCLMAGGAQAQGYDPYGPKPASNGPSPRDTRAVTPFIGMFDGTPRYELHPTPMGARSDAGASGLLAFNHQDYLPLDFGRGAPELRTEHGSYPVPFHYLVKYWETYPEAKERQGHVPRLGIVSDTIRQDDRNLPPPAVKAVLDRQARTVLDTITAFPFIQRSEAHYLIPTVSYHQQADPSGTRIWGFTLRLSFPTMASGTGRQRPDGRWADVTLLEGTAMSVCTNCYERLERPSGRYRGMQFTGLDRILVETIDRPLWVSRYRGGQGEQINNPELFDAGRPTGEIQLFIVTFPFAVGQGALAPDRGQARAIAAAWLPDWKAIVDRLNGPAAPRAD